MPRSFTRAEALENAAFLRHLRRTGNARAAAAALGASRSRFTKRRDADPAFAARWDAALAFAHAALGESQNMSPVQSSIRSGESPHPTRTRSGRFQLRRRPKTAITPEAEQAFLFALGATANVHLAAKAAGFAHSSFYTRKRTHPAFAREWRLALEQGFEQVEAALLASWSEDANEHDAWRHNAPPPVPPMTASQALQLLYLHQKEARLDAEPPHLKRRRGESREAHSYRLTAMFEAGAERARAEFRIAEALRNVPLDKRLPHEPPPPMLPDLAQVTGWSKSAGRRASGMTEDCRGQSSPADDPAKTPHDEGRALFGGWRIGDWTKAGEGKPHVRSFRAIGIV